jgi:hypothetical protein
VRYAVESDAFSIWTTGELSYLNGDTFHVKETVNQLGPAGVAQEIGDLENNWAIAGGSTIRPREVPPSPRVGGCNDSAPSHPIPTLTDRKVAFRGQAERICTIASSQPPTYLCELRFRNCARPAN